MALTLAPLLALPFAGLLIRRAGYRFDAWVLPVALGFHWLLIRGHGTQPVFLLAVALFVLVAAAAAFQGLGMEPAPARRSRQRTIHPKRHVVRANVAEALVPPTPVVRTIALPRPPPTKPVATPLPAEVASPEPPPARTPTVAVEQRALPPRDAAELLDRIEAAASTEQRRTLVERLRSSSESVAHLRTGTDQPGAVVGKAKTTAAHAWGDQRCDGLLVQFDGVAPRDSTVLVVLCDVADAADLLDESARDTVRGAAIVIPSDLAGVKRLGDLGETDARWLARAVFVPLDLLIGDVNAADREAGHGESVTGRPG